jgi:AI-2 transport protein TqsA
VNRTISYAAGFILVWIIGDLLIVGRSILIPIIIALFIWNLLNTIYFGMQRIPIVGPHLPAWVGRLLSLFAVVIMVKILIDIISNNVSDVIAASPRYQDNLTHLFNQIDSYYRIKALASFDGLWKDISLQSMIVNIYAVFSSMTSSAVLIILYIAFLFVEQHFFTLKMHALFPQPGPRQVIDSILSHIVRDMQTYLGLKTFLSLLASFLSWIIMKWAGLDFAEFWALLIFFLNFIPSIGPIVATAFPALLAMIQFQSWLPFALVTSGIIMVQFIVCNVLEPRFLSKSLNLSPLVILLALALWGAIWGIMGMFLSVPITVMMLIVFAHFDATRPIAILLSKDGYVKKAYEN